MDKNKLNAIISLLDDPNEWIYDSIKKSVIEECNETDTFWFEEAWNNSTDGFVMERIEDLIHNIKFQTTLQNVKKWKEKDPNNLFEILFLISKIFYEEANREEIWNSYKKIENQVWLELNNDLTALEKISMVNYILFQKHQFKKRYETDAIKDFFFTELIRHKQGNNLILGLLYMLICQNLDLPVYGVILPNNFTLCYTQHSSIYNPTDPVLKDQILFYIDPFNGGTAFQSNEIDYYLKKRNIKAERHYYQAKSNHEVVNYYINVLLQNLKYKKEMGIYKEIKAIQDIFDYKKDSIF